MNETLGTIMPDKTKLEALAEKLRKEYAKPSWNRDSTLLLKAAHELEQIAKEL